MKTTKITTTLASMTLIFFMSTSSIANTCVGYSGDGVKTAVKHQISAAKNNINAAVSTSGIEFTNLRFEVSKFIAADKSEISEVPMANEFDYLRFDVNKFSAANSGENELTSNEFDYLRFDVSKFESENTVSKSELSAK
jgi:hypothetical protein